MADYLSDNRVLKKSDIENLINENITSQMSFITNGELLYYRNHLKSAVAINELQHSPKFEKVISLNVGSK
jgi:hypothetical protein